MLRQYRPQRFRFATIRNRNLEIGTLPVGTIFTSTNQCGRTRKLIIEAWFPREIGAGRRDHLGRWANSYVAGGGHLALCRDLSNGQRLKMSDQFIRFAADHC